MLAAAVTRELGVVRGARTVSFLIADLSGRALVRLAHVPFSDDGGGRRDGDEVATVVTVRAVMCAPSAHVIAVTVTALSFRHTRDG